MGILNRIKTLFLIAFFVASGTVYSQSKNFKVALDAGHGGKDFGAVYGGHIEKNIALNVVLKVGKILESTPGIDVVYTRKTDVFVDLIERANIANRADSHVFVSIHCNAAPGKNSTASGTETFVMGLTKNASNLEAARRENAVITLEKDHREKYEGFDPNNPESKMAFDISQELYLDNSIALASKIQDNFTDVLKKKNRGVKQAPFMVLHKAYMPRVLVEMGFLSNPTDGAYLDSEIGQREMAESIADAIISYKKEYFGDGSASDDMPKPSSKVKDVPSSKREPDTIIPEPIVRNEPVAQVQTRNEPTKPATPASTPEPEAVAGVTFKIQLAVSSTKLDLTPTNFNGLGQLSMQPEGNLFKYMYGATNSYEDARRLLGDAKEKGYSSAFVVAYKNGKRISITDAIKR